MWLLLFFSGVAVLMTASKRSPPKASDLPQAKIEDGKSIPAPPQPPPKLSTKRLVLGLMLMGAGLLLAALLEDLSNLGMQMGRPLRRRGRPQLPPLAMRGGEPARVHRLGVWRSAQLARRWLRAARAEHASVPAFEQLAARLAAIGASEELRARCQRAADDERRHAARCFAIARGYSGIAWSAGAMPAPSYEAVSVEQLATESLVDGCLGEGIAADVAKRGAELASDPEIASTLSTIADDEARHAELAWSVVELCIARSGQPIRAQLALAIDRAPSRVSAGPTGVPRAEVAELVAARTSAVRARLATIA